MIPKIEWPMVFYTGKDMMTFSFVENGKARELAISRRDVGILLRSIGGSIEREYRPVELIEHDMKCAV